MHTMLMLCIRNICMDCFAFLKVSNISNALLEMLFQILLPIPAVNITDRLKAMFLALFIPCRAYSLRGFLVFYPVQSLDVVFVGTI